MTKKNMIWAPSNGFSDDPYEEERMAERFHSRKEKKGMKKKHNVVPPKSFEEWLRKKKTDVDKVCLGSDTCDTPVKFVM
jgi:hypothetical protein